VCFPPLSTVTDRSLATTQAGGQTTLPNPRRLPCRIRLGPASRPGRPAGRHAGCNYRCMLGNNAGLVPGRRRSYRAGTFLTVGSSAWNPFRSARSTGTSRRSPVTPRGARLIQAGGSSQTGCTPLFAASKLMCGVAVPFVACAGSFIERRTSLADLSTIVRDGDGRGGFTDLRHSELTCPRSATASGVRAVAFIRRPSDLAEIGRRTSNCSPRLGNGCPS